MLSNVIWSNGLLDPWHGGGFLEPVAGSSTPVIVMPKGAHHLDLRGPHTDDPGDVTYARLLEKKILWEWIQEWVEADVQRPRHHSHHSHHAHHGTASDL